MKEDKKRTLKTVLNICLQVTVGILFTAVFSAYCLFRWSVEEFDFTIDSIIFTLTTPLDGTNDAMLESGLNYCIPRIVAFVLLYVSIVSAVNIAIYRAKRRYVPKIREPLAARAKSYTALFLCVCILMLTGFSYHTFYVADAHYDIVGYLNDSRLTTTLYEDYFVDPKDADLRFAGGKKKNLVYVYLESMETTYAHYEKYGKEQINLIPNLERIASENVNFSHTDGFGGLYVAAGASATMMALFASTSGIPFCFPNGGNDMIKRGKFATGVTALGDILAEQGYRQTFLCGSDGAYAGRGMYFRQHGNYGIYDLGVAQRNGDLPAPDYHDGWWGFEDMYLYEIAKKRLTELAEGDAPFNLTMLTVDTHAPLGHQCERCRNSSGTLAERVAVCADSQFSEFMDWCKQQDFYRDTVFVISGDHFRMDREITSASAERAVYNCVINGERPAEFRTQNRMATALDMFPTTLYALGFTWEGERLGLGTNLFSGRETLAEEMGIGTMNREIKKKSPYYLKNFS